MKFTKEQLDEGLIKPGEFIELCSNDINGSVKFDQNRLKLLNKAAAEYARMQWRDDMENAPKNIPIWLSDGFSMCVGFWYEERWAKWFLAMEGKLRQLDLDFKPSYWMLLPSPPEQGAGE